MIKSKPILLLVLFGFQSICGCVFAGTPTLKELNAAPETITVGGRSLVLQTYLWRDFMPISPPGGKPLIASLTLRTVDHTPLPRGIEVVRVWLVNGEALWSPTKKEIRKEEAPSSTMEIVVRDGPKWGPGIRVDIIIELKDNHNRLRLLRASKQPIHRTD